MCCADTPPPTSASAGLLAAAPDIPLNTQGAHWLQVGNPDDAYWVENNAWGAEGITQGPNPDQYEQQTGISTQVGPNGEVAWRTKWRWPSGNSEVKGYPAILSGRKPGYYSSSNLVDGQPVILPDGSVSQTAPSGATPGTFLPLRMPLAPVTSRFNYEHLQTPTGQGQLVYDLWLQSQPGQDSGFSNSSITHEIMIVLDNWGGYGSYGGVNGAPHVANERNPNWYDHDAVIDGKTYHVYVTKGSDGAFLYNFGSLNGNYGHTGWKMIAFLPAQLPVAPGEINLASFVNYLATRSDVYGNKWAEGNEYLVSAELGVEPVEGTGDIAVYDYKLFQGAPGGTPGGTGDPTHVEAEAGTLTGTGVAVHTDQGGYQGSGFVGYFSDAGDRLTLDFPNVAAGTYDVRIRYQAWTDQQNDVLIDGVPRNEAFPATGDSTWQVKTLGAVSLTAGNHTIAISKDWGWMAVDWVEIVPASAGPTPTAAKLQAEAGTLSGTGVGIHTDQGGYEGTGFVGYFSDTGDRLTLSFPNVVAGTYDVRIRYQAWTDQQNDVLIDDVPRNEAFPATGDSTWQVKTLAGVALGAGNHTIAIRKDWGWMGVDWIEIVPTP